MFSINSPRPEASPTHLHLRRGDTVDPAFADLCAEILGRGAALRVKVTGWSMAPFLRGGEVLTIKPCSSQGVRVGDVVLFRTREGCLAIHRVLRRRRQADDGWVFHTKGDARAVLDEPIPASCVLGKVCAVERDPGSPTARYWNLESACWKAINRLIAMGGLLGTRVTSVLSRLRTRP